MTAPAAKCAPFLKWAGGKRQLLPILRAHLPTGIADYYEPFVGSGALFFDLAFRGMIRGTAHLWDQNPGLVNVYRVLRDSRAELVELLSRHKKQHDPADSAYYYRQRARFNATNPDTIEHAAMFIYLNKTCFNGLFRVNSKGRFNVPMGAYKNPGIFDPENLRAVSRALEEVELKVADFRELDPAGIKAGSFVYFDPPYQPLDTTSNFTSYTRGSFSESDQRHLADLFGRLRNAGIPSMLSNSWTPLVKELYAEFHIQPIQARRSINSNGGKRGRIPEALVLNYAAKARS